MPFLTVSRNKCFWRPVHLVPGVTQKLGPTKRVRGPALHQTSNCRPQRCLFYVCIYIHSGSKLEAAGCCFSVSVFDGEVPAGRRARQDTFLSVVPLPTATSPVVVRPPVLIIFSVRRPPLPHLPPLPPVFLSLPSSRNGFGGPSSGPITSQHHPHRQPQQPPHQQRQYQQQQGTPHYGDRGTATPASRGVPAGGRGGRGHNPAAATADAWTARDPTPSRGGLFEAGSGAGAGAGARQGPGRHGQEHGQGYGGTGMAATTTATTGPFKTARELRAAVSSEEPGTLLIVKDPKAGYVLLRRFFRGLVLPLNGASSDLADLGVACHNLDLF